MSRTTRLMFAMLSLFFIGSLGTGCKKGDQGEGSDVVENVAETVQSNTTAVRVVNASGASSVDVSINGLPLVSGLNQNNYTPERVPAVTGSVNVKVGSHANSLIDQNIDLSADQKYTFVVVGNGSAGYNLAIIKDDLSGAAGKNRFANAIPGVGAITVEGSNGGSVASGVDYGRASKFASVPEGFKSISVKAGGNDLGNAVVPKAPASRAVTTVVVQEGQGIRAINISDRP